MSLENYLEEEMREMHEGIRSTLGNKIRRSSKENYESYVDEKIDIAYKEFIISRGSREAEDNYCFALDLLKRFNYTLDDALRTLPKLDESTDGIFFSAMLNKLMTKDDDVEIEVSNRLHYLGMFHENGKLTIKANSKFYRGYPPMYLGYKQKGGSLVLNLPAGRGVGDYREGGDLIINEMCQEGLLNVKGGNVKILSIVPIENFGNLAKDQESGEIVIMCDIPKIVGYVGPNQKGGKLIVEGTSYARDHAYGQEGGSAIFKDIFADHQGGGSLAWLKKGGEILVEGDFRGSSVGVNQKSGKTSINGNCEADIGQDCKSSAELYVRGNVNGNVGRYAKGGKIIIDGNLKGNIGDLAEHSLKVKVAGDVHGNIDLLSIFGSYDDKKLPGFEIEVGGMVDGDVRIHRNSKVTVCKKVTGTVGDGMVSGEINVDISVGKVGDSFGGEVINLARKTFHA